MESNTTTNTSTTRRTGKISSALSMFENNIAGNRKEATTTTTTTTTTPKATTFATTAVRASSASSSASNRTPKSSTTTRSSIHKKYGSGRASPNRPGNHNNNSTVENDDGNDNASEVASITSALHDDAKEDDVVATNGGSLSSSSRGYPPTSDSPTLRRISSIHPKATTTTTTTPTSHSKTSSSSSTTATSSPSTKRSHVTSSLRSPPFVVDPASAPTSNNHNNNGKNEITVSNEGRRISTRSASKQPQQHNSELNDRSETSKASRSSTSRGVTTSSSSLRTTASDLLETSQRSNRRSQKHANPHGTKKNRLRDAELNSSINSNSFNSSSSGPLVLHGSNSHLDHSNNDSASSGVHYTASPSLSSKRASSHRNHMLLTRNPSPGSGGSPRGVSMSPIPSLLATPLSSSPAAAYHQHNKKKLTSILNQYKTDTSPRSPLRTDSDITTLSRRSGVSASSASTAVTNNTSSHVAAMNQNSNNNNSNNNNSTNDDKVTATTTPLITTTEASTAITNTTTTTATTTIKPRRSRSADDVASVVVADSASTAEESSDDGEPNEIIKEEAETTRIPTRRSSIYKDKQQQPANPRRRNQNTLDIKESEASSSSPLEATNINAHHPPDATPSSSSTVTVETSPTSGGGNNINNNNNNSGAVSILRKPKHSNSFRNSRLGTTTANTTTTIVHEADDTTAPHEVTIAKPTTTITAKGLATEKEISTSSSSTINISDDPKHIRRNSVSAPIQMSLHAALIKKEYRLKNGITSSPSPSFAEPPSQPRPATPTTTTSIGSSGSNVPNAEGMDQGTTTDVITTMVATSVYEDDDDDNDESPLTNQVKDSRFRRNSTGLFSSLTNRWKKKPLLNHKTTTSDENEATTTTKGTTIPTTPTTNTMITTNANAVQGNDTKVLAATKIRSGDNQQQFLQLELQQPQPQQQQQQQPQRQPQQQPPQQQPQLQLQRQPQQQPQQQQPQQQQPQQQQPKQQQQQQQQAQHNSSSSIESHIIQTNAKMNNVRRSLSDDAIVPSDPNVVAKSRNKGRSASSSKGRRRHSDIMSYNLDGTSKLDLLKDDTDSDDNISVPATNDSDKKDRQESMQHVGTPKADKAMISRASFTSKAVQKDDYDLVMSPAPTPTLFHKRTANTPSPSSRRSNRVINNSGHVNAAISSDGLNVETNNESGADVVGTAGSTPKAKKVQKIRLSVIGNSANGADNKTDDNGETSPNNSSSFVSVVDTPNGGTKKIVVKTIRRSTVQSQENTVSSSDVSQESSLKQNEESRDATMSPTTQARNFSSFQKRKEKFVLTKQVGSFSSSTSQLIIEANLEKKRNATGSLNSSAPQLSLDDDSKKNDSSKPVIGILRDLSNDGKRKRSYRVRFEDHLRSITPLPMQPNPKLFSQRPTIRCNLYDIDWYKDRVDACDLPWIHDAAIKIQCLYRGWKLRKRMRRRYLENKIRWVGIRKQEEIAAITRDRWQKMEKFRQKLERKYKKAEADVVLAEKLTDMLTRDNDKYRVHIDQLDAYNRDLQIMNQHLEQTMITHRLNHSMIVNAFELVEQSNVRLENEIQAMKAKMKSIEKELADLDRITEVEKTAKMEVGETIDAILNAVQCRAKNPRLVAAVFAMRRALIPDGDDNNNTKSSPNTPRIDDYMNSLNHESTSSMTHISETAQSYGSVTLGSKSAYSGSSGSSTHLTILLANLASAQT